MDGDLETRQAIVRDQGSNPPIAKLHKLMEERQLL